MHYLYDECRALETAIHNQLLLVANYAYLVLINNTYTGYYSLPMIIHVGHLYYKYTQIATTKLEANVSHLE